MTNQSIAKIFKELAQLLAIKKENPYKVRAYESAARVIESLPLSFESMAKEGKDLTELPSIGEQIAKKLLKLPIPVNLASLSASKHNFRPIFSLCFLLKGWELNIFEHSMSIFILKQLMS